MTAPWTLSLTGSSSVDACGTLVQSPELYPYVEESGKAKKNGPKCMGRVEWVDHPFAQGGDSGSLVWATVKGRKVPVGIHRGSGDGESFFMLLQPIFDLIEEIHDELD
jgi:hypothetical protein